MTTVQKYTMYCSKATVHNVTATVQQCTMWTARAHCKDVLYKIWDIQCIAILILPNVRWYEMLFWYWTLNVWIGGKISCSKILIVGVVSTFDVALIISIYSVWIAQVRAQCRWNSKCAQSVDEIQDGRFEADEVEVEEVRRNKTTLSCAIWLRLATEFLPTSPS